MNKVEKMRKWNWALYKRFGDNHNYKEFKHLIDLAKTMCIKIRHSDNTISRDVKYTNEITFIHALYLSIMKLVNDVNAYDNLPYCVNSKIQFEYTLWRCKTILENIIIAK